jgi:hypothetical protein
VITSIYLANESDQLEAGNTGLTENVLIKLRSSLSIIRSREPAQFMNSGERVMDIFVNEGQEYSQLHLLFVLSARLESFFTDEGGD